MSGVELINYNAARKALAQCARVDEVKDIHDKAEAMKKYAQLANDKQLMGYATEITMRAKRRMGEILIKMKETGERRSGRGAENRWASQKTGFQTGTPELVDLGLTKKQSGAWQQLGAVPEKDFEAMVEDTQ